MRFAEIMNVYKDESANLPEPYLDIVRDSLVKRFEYTLEVAWKSCKRYLLEEGFLEATTGSQKSIMRLAAEVGVIRRADSWMHYINARQNTSYDYSEADCVLAIVDEFYPDVINLYQTLSGKGWNIESKP